MVVASALSGSVSPALAAFPTTSSPQLQLNHVLRTSPFVGSSVSMQDNEGSAYVAQDNSLWLADDNGKLLYEVNPSTGALKRTITRKTLEGVKQYGGGTVAAGSNRDRDLESLAYDSVNDILYAFSGPCCDSTVLPTVFRLTRSRSGKLLPESYQPLATGSDFTGAAWNPGDGNLYVGTSSSLRSYDYQTNTAGQPFGVTGVTRIYGLTFSADGADLYVARGPAQLSRVDWATKALVSGWTFDLTPFGLLDARAVEVFNDQFWVSDGYDFRTSGDPQSHAVFVLDVVAPTAPTASFTSSVSGGAAPLSVAFTDTSTGAPTSWAWAFGDGGSATSQNPTHSFATAGTYTVTLTATNGSGSTSATGTITVTSPPPPPAPTASFTSSVSGGAAPLSVTFTDTSTGAPTSWAWAFGDGGSDSSQNPTHSYTSAGTYTVT
ncbi:MAG: PKD domain-containing protein, partial [Actinomycetota bacterium]|nr:PKD domain-containing protein [Actinomycetota bacterium]